MKYIIILLSFYTLNLFSQSSCFININDTFIENNIPIELSLTGSYSTILWDNGATSNTTNYNIEGVHWVTVTEIDTNTNLVVNGDFEAGRTGFTSGYTVAYPGASSFGPLAASCYEVYSSPRDGHRLFLNCNDKTNSPGTKMLVVNGSEVPNDVWCQTISVIPNSDYIFSSWVTNVLNDTNVAQLQFKINGNLIGSTFLTTEIGCEWKQFYAIWNSGSSTSADICIRNLNLTYEGNDFAIDEIKFSGVCKYTDTFFIDKIDTICKLNIPNAFSPNNDNNNDYFKVFYSCKPTNYDLQIYNRWGELVFQTNEISNFWDGKYKELEQLIGVYAYQIKCKFNNDEDLKLYKGNITLFR